MSEFRKKIKEINTPAVHNRRDSSVVAKVTQVDEINNVCSVSFIDKDGYKSNKDNVPVKIFMPSFIGWFPKEGDLVNAEMKDNNLTILSINEDGYRAQIRSGNQTKQDIYSNSFGGTIGGNIF